MACGAMSPRVAVLAVALALLAVTVGTTAGRQPAAPAPAVSAGVFAELDGRWAGTGIILGQPSRVQMEWAAVLDGRFVRLTFVSHIGTGPTGRRFEGHAYYERRTDGSIRATWFDSGGLVRPITAVERPGTLVSAWGTPATEEGETTYSVTAPGVMQVVDRVKSKDGSWREFGRSTLSRTLRPE